MFGGPIAVDYGGGTVAASRVAPLDIIIAVLFKFVVYYDRYPCFCVCVFNLTVVAKVQCVEFAFFCFVDVCFGFMH